MASKTVKPPVPESKTPMGKLLALDFAVCAFELAKNVIETKKAIILNLIDDNYCANIFIFSELAVSSVL
jgi:hypothetical protein